MPGAQFHRPFFALTLAWVLVMVSCGGGRPIAESVGTPDEFTATIFASGFDGPTQMVIVGDDLLVAELNGRENDGTGRILRLSLEDPQERVVLQTGLDKPTGIAVTGGRLWIMERDRLSVTTLASDARREVVAQDLPNNGRSEGTLTVTPDGQLLYNTSGSKRGPTRVDGSGMLFAIDDAAEGPSTPRVIAEGFKHAYAQVIAPDGQLFTVEMTDGRFDEQRAPDELVAISPGDDGGWPQCVGDNRVVSEFGGTDRLCAGSPRSHAIFGVGATPTSLVIAPWDADTILAPLWLRSEVVAVPRMPNAAGPHEPTVFLTGIESPQHLLAWAGDLLVSDHETGQIFLVSPD